MVNVKRWLRHCFTPKWVWQRYYPAATLTAIERAVADSERLHRGELCFVIENALSGEKAWRGVSALQRALEIFAKYKVWDTEENIGVLIYLCLADREVHILADRGINRCVPVEQWQRIVGVMQQEFLHNRLEKGALLGIGQVTDILVRHFPAGDANQNELPNRPAVI